MSGDVEWAKVRLQGGPFDGERKTIPAADLLPRIYASRCVNCGVHLWREPVDRCEAYRRDEERGDLVIYVFTDESVLSGLPADREVVHA